MSSITLENKYIGPVNWENEALCDHDLSNNIDIWQIDINAHLSHIDKLRSVLTPDEIDRANRYLRNTDGDKFIISRGALRHILSGYLNYQPQDIRFKLTKSKKPEVDTPSVSNFHFNLSDSADSVVIAIATTPVGIDIELINPKFSYHAILNNNFSLDEADYINLNDNFQRFFLLWTRKEAILKATGIGLTDHLKLIPSLDGKYVMEGALLATENDWQLNSFETADNYITTIASHMLKKNFRFFNFK